MKSFLIKFFEMQNKKYSLEKVGKLPSLWFCIVMDVVGMASYLFPGIGEWFDVIWAPVSAFILYRTFGGGTIAIVGSIIDFIEEIVPFSDIIPTFTLTYFYAKYVEKRKKRI